MMGFGHPRDDGAAPLFDAASGTLRASFVAKGAAEAAIAPGGRFAGAGDLSPIVRLVSGAGVGPMEDFVKLGRRDDPSEVLPPPPSMTK